MKVTYIGGAPGQGAEIKILDMGSAGPARKIGEQVFKLGDEYDLSVEEVRRMRLRERGGFVFPNEKRVVSKPEPEPKAPPKAAPAAKEEK